MKPVKTSYCASAFIIDPDTQKILLMYHKKFQNWVQPGGHLKPGETPEAAAIRKAYEEVGLRIKLVTGKPFMVEEYNNFVGHLLDYQYVAVLDGKGQMPQVTDACYDVDWFSLEELKNIPVFPDVKTKAMMFIRPRI